MAADYPDLAAAVAASLTRAGLSLYDLRAPEGSVAAAAGGVAVMPDADRGVLVLWEVHDDLAKPAVAAEDDERPADPALILERQVRAAMLGALYEILRASGYQVTHDPGSATGVRAPSLIVTGRAPLDRQPIAPPGADEFPDPADVAELRGEGLLVAPGPYAHTRVQVRPGAAPGGKRAAVVVTNEWMADQPGVPYRQETRQQLMVPHLAESARTLAKLLDDAADVAEELDDQAPEHNGAGTSQAPEPWRL